MAPPTSTGISSGLNRAESIFTGELCLCTRLSLAEIIVLAGGAIPPARAVPASTRIFARMKCVQGHSSPVNIKKLLAGRLLAGYVPIQWFIRLAADTRDSLLTCCREAPEVLGRQSVCQARSLA